MEESTTEAVIATDESDSDSDIDEYEDYGVWDDYFDEVPVITNNNITTTTPKPEQNIKAKKGTFHYFNSCGLNSLPTKMLNKHIA